jgi:Spy/CpxP family protein refolding chaperone
MNRLKQHEEAAQNKNHLIKEDAMTKEGNKKSRRSRHFFPGILAAGVLIGGLTLTIQANSADAGGFFGQQRSPEQIMERLTDRLDLTPEQVEAIRPVIEVKVLKMNEIRENAGEDRRAVRSEILKLRWETERKFDDILTDKQLEEYLELREERRGGMYGGKQRSGWMGKGVNRTPKQAVARLTDRLDLTDEQVAEITPIIEESMKKKRVVFDKYGDQRLTNREAMRSEMHAIGDATHDQLATILTAEQMEKLNAIQEERRARADKWMNRSGPRRF